MNEVPQVDYYVSVVCEDLDGDSEEIVVARFPFEEGYKAISLLMSISKHNRFARIKIEEF